MLRHETVNEEQDNDRYALKQLSAYNNSNTVRLLKT